MTVSQEREIKNNPSSVIEVDEVGIIGSEIDYKEKYLMLAKQHVREMEKSESIIHDLVDLCITEISDVEDVSAIAVAQEYLAR